eukprot:scaffold2621_cov31-Tisochrysis_lutea.AAC.7
MTSTSESSPSSSSPSSPSTPPEGTAPLPFPAVKPVLSVTPEIVPWAPSPPLNCGCEPVPSLREAAVLPPAPMADSCAGSRRQTSTHRSSPPAVIT